MGFNTIAFLNESKEISPDDFDALVTLLQFQLFAHFCPAWAIEPTPILACESRADVAPDSAIFHLTDAKADEEGVLAFHTEENDGTKDGPIYVKTLVDNGSKVLTGPYSVLGTCGHEVFELLVDPSCNRWADGPDGQYSLEVCDPTEAQFYRMTVPIGDKTFEGDGTNFVTPDYFDLNGKKFDYMGVLKAPFTLADGGYVVKRTGAVGSEQQVFGATVPPDWRVNARKMNAHSRTARRMVRR